jgi:hypothetical protein
MPDAKVYDAVKGEWVNASKEQAALHHAVAEGGKLPSDRTQDELDRLEPAFAGPSITAGPEAAPADVATGAGAGTRGAAGGGRAT